MNQIDHLIQVGEELAAFRELIINLCKANGAIEGNLVAPQSFA